jgi:hypothetical protein
MAYKWSQGPGDWLYDLPIIGDDLARLGKIQEIYFTPCSPDAIVWVKAFFQQVPTAMLSLYKPQLIDVNIKHRGGKPRKAKKLKWSPSIFFRDALVEIPVPRWVPFRVWEGAQRIGWYFLVADVAEHVAINWMSTAYKLNACQAAFLIYYRAKATGALTGGTDGTTTTNLPLGLTAVSNIETQTYRFILTHPGRYKVTWSMDFEPYQVTELAAMPYTTSLYCYTDNTHLTPGEVGSYEDGRKYASGSCDIILESGPAGFYIAGSWNRGGYCYCNGEVSVDFITGDELSPDP